MKNNNNHSPNIIGAYYFDGWTGTYSNHITKSLVDSFSVREPKWGWLTSTQKIVDKQILEASKVGVSFFSFCWYMNSTKTPEMEPLNRALGFFRQSKYNSRLKYCVMVANHEGHEIEENDWDLASDYWLELFKDQNYLMVNDKPLIIFFSLSSLVKKFGSPQNVKNSLERVRQKAIKSGLKGVQFSICLYPSKNMVELADSCGFDILTGYNYHSVGFKQNEQKIPIDSLRAAERKVWDLFKSFGKLNYIPVSTLNWDPRPWSNRTNNYDKAPYYIGFSAESVYRSVKNCIEWMNSNTEYITKEKIAILYAWNENGEGAWLTPGKNGFNPSDGLKKAIREEK